MNNIREYRARRLDNGEWVKGDLIREGHGAYIQYYEKTTWVKVEVDPETISQWTGGTDAYGQQIYEDDIVACKGYSPNTSAGVVCYSYGALEYKVIWMMPDGGSYISSLGSWLGDIKVVGNIHDNPELVGVTRNED